MTSLHTRGLLLELLGVSVRVTCDDPEHFERLALCYARSICAEADPDASNGSAGVVEAELERAGDGWRVTVTGRESCEVDDWVLAIRVFNHELMHGVMLCNRSLYYIHASVVRLDGRGILMPGLSQAGKSTLALAFVAAGAQLLSDELLAFDLETQTARAFPRALKIRDVCTEYFPAHRKQFVGDGEGRFLPFDALPADIVASETSIDVILLPRWVGEADGNRPGGLVPVSPGKALLELATSSLNFGTHRVQSLDFLADVVRGTRAFELAWHDPHRAVRDLVEALAR